MKCALEYHLFIIYFSLYYLFGFIWQIFSKYLRVSLDLYMPNLFTYYFYLFISTLLLSYNTMSYIKDSFRFFLNDDGSLWWLKRTLHFAINMCHGNGIHRFRESSWVWMGFATTLSAWRSVSLYFPYSLSLSRWVFE